MKVEKQKAGHKSGKWVRKEESGSEKQKEGPKVEIE